MQIDSNGRSKRNENIAKTSRTRVKQLSPSLLDYMEKIRPAEVHEKAHAYPVSVPELWREDDGMDIDWKEVSLGPARLYVHIPWCRSRCTFCFYESKGQEPGEDEFNTYLGAIEMEMKLLLDHLGKTKFCADVLYIGGGTPTVLNTGQMDRMLETIHKYTEFVEGSFLISESSPGTITKDKIEMLKHQGINRISIGVQSFNDEILKKCNRDHDKAKAVNAYRIVREVGIEEVNFDLMLALPGQTVVDFANTLDVALDLAPSSLSFLDLRIAEGSTLHRSGDFYPTWIDDICMRATYQHKISENGRYERTRPHYYVLPNEARNPSTRVPCMDSRSGYGNQIGFGYTAYSHVGKMGYINHKAPDYADMLKSGKLPISHTMALSPADVIAMKAIRSLVDQTSIPRTRDVFEQYKTEISYLVENGLVDDNLMLTDDGCLFGEEIAYLLYPKRS